MNAKQVTTRKIQLIINSEDPQEVQRIFTTLYQWQYACFRAANYIFTHYYMQERLKDFFYLSEGIKLKLDNVLKDENGMLNTSRQNTVYKVLSQHFKGTLPLRVLTTLNTQLYKYFTAEKDYYIKGERPVRNYQRNIPIPFSAGDLVKLHLTEDGKNYSFSLFKQPFRTYLGNGHDKFELLQQVLNGQVKLCASALQLYKKKIYLLLTTDQAISPVQTIDPDVVAEASLGIDHPLVLTIQRERFIIGNREEFLYQRLAIQAAMNRVQQTTGTARGGHGRARKMKALDRFSKAEYDYVQQKLHVYSRRLIDHCVDNGAGTLLLTHQQDKEAAAKEDAFLLRNWSYHSFKEKIMYKAAKAGILVISE
ncbi:hypothetical protein [Mucilaginibacter defluvii]|uniref:Transposase n=1 Tax=Mucilaginibacter defluvii TaxID=1196019 RepID=A0ABP9FNA8_9SPHI